MEHTDNCGRSGRKDVVVANCKMNCACKCHDTLEHGEKIVDGIRDLNLPWTLHITQTGAAVLNRDKAAVCFVDRTMVETVREMIRRLNAIEENSPIG